MERRWDTMEKGDLWGPNGEPWCTFGKGLDCTNGFMCRNPNHVGSIGHGLEKLRASLMSPELTKEQVVVSLRWIQGMAANGSDQE